MANPVTNNIDGSNPGPAGISAVNTQYAYGNAYFQLILQVTMTPVSVAAASAVEQSFGLNGVTFVTATTGIKPGDVISAISPPADVAGVTPTYGRVDSSSADKFYVKFVNPTAGALTPAAGVYSLTVWRPTNGNLANPITAVLG